MRKTPIRNPTDAELAILRVLWARGPSTVRQVHEVLTSGRSLAYTTTLKLLQIMTEKGLVRRVDRDPVSDKRPTRGHVYEASVPAETTQRQLVGDLLDRAFGGSAQQLILQALAAKRANRAELAEIRRLLDQFEKRGRS